MSTCVCGLRARGHCKYAVSQNEFRALQKDGVELALAVSQSTKITGRLGGVPFRPREAVDVYAARTYRTEPKRLANESRKAPGRKGADAYTNQLGRQATHGLGLPAGELGLGTCAWIKRIILFYIYPDTCIWAYVINTKLTDPSACRFGSDTSDGTRYFPGATSSL